MDVEYICRALRDELNNCNCHASSVGDCACGAVWPEQVASEAADLIERLSAIAGRLPKTEDGVPVTPGMTYWYEYDDEPGEFGSDIASDIEDNTHSNEFLGCFSSLEAAKAAGDKRCF